MLKRSYYLTLDCRPAKSDDDFRSAFRNLVKHYHPDTVGPNGTPFLQKIVEAYRVLSQSDRRTAYQRGLQHAGEMAEGESPRPVPEATAGLAPTLPTSARSLGELRVIWPALGQVRERMLGNFLRGEPPEEQRTEPIDIQVILQPDDALAGGVAVIDAPVYYPCPRCHGFGQNDDAPCRMCGKTGLIAETELLRVTIPPLGHNRQPAEIPLRGLGVHNFYLRLHFRVVPS